MDPSWIDPSWMDGPSELTIQDVKDRHKSQGKKCIYIFVFTFPNNWKPQNRTGEERKKERKKEKKRNRKGKKNNNNNKTTRKETPEAGCRKPDGIDQSESKPLAWFLKQFFFSWNIHRFIPFVSFQQRICRWDALRLVWRFSRAWLSRCWLSRYSRKDARVRSLEMLWNVPILNENLTFYFKLLDHLNGWDSWMTLFI